jgi:hypothetical protein
MTPQAAATDILHRRFDFDDLALYPVVAARATELLDRMEARTQRVFAASVDLLDLAKGEVANVGRVGGAGVLAPATRGQVASPPSPPVPDPTTTPDRGMGVPLRPGVVNN